MGQRECSFKSFEHNIRLPVKHSLSFSCRAILAKSGLSCSEVAPAIPALFLFHPLILFPNGWLEEKKNKNKSQKMTQSRK